MSEETQKVPSQVFKWFERMKESNELSVQNTLKRFESITTNNTSVLIHRTILILNT